MVEAGNLREQITIQHDVGNTTTQRGQHIEDWQTFVVCRAEIDQTDSAEVAHGGMIKAINTYAIATRFVASLMPTNDMRIIWNTNGDKVLNITSVTPSYISKEHALIRAIGTS